MKKILLGILYKAIHFLYTSDKRNLTLEVSERNICARLAFHIENLMRLYDRKNGKEIFKNYFVDVEYNRMESIDGKPIKKSIIYQDNVCETIVCDLLVHSRGINKERDNLLALEMKRTYNKDSIESDNKRLIRLISPPPEKEKNQTMYNTLLGVFLTCDKASCVITVYEWDSESQTYRTLISEKKII